MPIQDDLIAYQMWYQESVHILQYVPHVWLKCHHHQALTIGNGMALSKLWCIGLELKTG